MSDNNTPPKDSSNNSNGKNQKKKYVSMSEKKKEIETQGENQKILRRKKLSQTFSDADKQPDPVYIYHEMISEGTLNIIFGNTGIGKTFLGYQIGFDFCKLGFNVIYACLELNEKQVRMRSPTVAPPDKFERLDFNSDYIEQKFEFTNILDEVRECLDTTEGKTVLIVDKSGIKI